MKKLILFLAFGMASFIGFAQSITLSPTASYPFSVKTGGSGAGYYGDFSTSSISGLQYYYVSSSASSLGTEAGNIFGSASRFGMNSNTSLILRTASLDRMTILSTGNVGVGTSTPTTRFEISQANANTDLRISADCGFCSTRLSFISDKATGGWRPGYIASGDHGTFTGRLDFYTNGTGSTNQYGNVLSMSLMNKRVSIGGGFTSAISYPLELHSPDIYGFAIYNQNNISKWEQYSSSSGNFELFANDNYRGVFNGTTGAYSSVSDRSLKNNIAPLNSILDKVLSLQTSTFEYNINNPTNRKSIGLIAQDVEAIFPEFVYKNALERTGKEIYTMDYAGLSVIALKAIQEQQVMIKELQAEILKLKK